MKKNIGSQLALYPTPVTVIGAMNGDKPTWTLVAHVGIIGHDRVLVSLAAPHFINGCIKKTQKLSINIVDEEMLPLADYAGSVSGAKEDKSDLFTCEMGEGGAPVITSAPLTMECTVEDVYNTPNFESFICKIDGTYVRSGKNQLSDVEAGIISVSDIRILENGRRNREVSVFQEQGVRNAKRIRNPTNARRDEIIEACAKLYQTMNFKEITIKESRIISV